jgi:hypothetical protein
MVFNATFNNISVIAWQSVLLVDVKSFNEKWGHSGHDRMIAGFITNYAISTYPH